MVVGLKGFVVLVVTLSVAGSAYAKISDSVIERDGRGIILLAEPFGFGTEGHLDMTVSNLELHRSNVDAALQGFFITSTQVLTPQRLYAKLLSFAGRSSQLLCGQCSPRLLHTVILLIIQAEAQLEIDLEQGTCALEAETAIKLLTLKQVEDNAKEGQNSTSLSDTMTNLVPSYNGGEWSLFFANCQKPSVVSFELTVSMYNVHGGQRDYLAIGEDMIPSVYLVSLQQPDKRTSRMFNIMARICSSA